MRSLANIAVLMVVLVFFVGCSSSTGNGAEEPTIGEDEGGTQAAAEDKPWYEGETITLVVTTKPGGGYDTYGRMVAKYMEEYLPGSTIIVKNVPGAGHIIGVNEIYASEPDGLTFGIFNSAMPLAQLTNQEGVKFDLSKMSWLGGAATTRYSWIMGKNSPYQSVEDVQKAEEEVVLGSAGKTSKASVIPQILKEIMDLNLKVVQGYAGGEAELAMMRNEVDGQFQAWDSIHQFVEDGNAVPIMFMAEDTPEGYEDVPLVRDVVTDEQWQPLITTLLSLNICARPFAGPPDIPEDRLNTLRDAFEKAVHDPAFVEMGDKLGRPINYISGERSQELYSGISDLSDENREMIKSAYGG